MKYVFRPKTGFSVRHYISKAIKEKLLEQGLELITKIKKNMKFQFLDPIKECWLDKRGIIEAAIGQLKSIFHIQHTRHRSIANFFANVLAGLVAYVFKPKKATVSFAKTITHQVLLTSN